MRAAFVFFAALSLPALAQPPVILLNGYQLACNASEASSGTFGQLEPMLRAQGRAVHFFNNCAVRPGGRPVIEELAQALGILIDSLNVPQVDLVCHSMGGLIARTYLSGKQTTLDRFSPPALKRVRKLITLGSTHFGFTGLLVNLAPDVQAQAQVPGSRFLLDLATWNQGREDLREVDALAIVGNAGAGGASDGLVAVTSAVYPFWTDVERTRVVPYCHTDLGIISTCRAGVLNIANINSPEHLSWKIISSFLSGTDEWRRTGDTPASDSVLSRSAGLVVSYKNSNDDFIGDVRSITYSGGELNRVRDNFFYKEALTPGAYKFQLESATEPASTDWTAAGGTYSVVSVKQGPKVLLVIPAAARVATLNRAPGMFISVYGENFAREAAQATSLPLPRMLGAVSVLVDDRTIQLQYAGPSQINAVLPEDVSGLVRLTVRSPGGQHSVNVLIETAVPAVFTINGGGTGPAAAINALTGEVVGESAPLRAGDVVSLYVTGLGPTRDEGGLAWAVNQPAVTLGGRECTLLYAGRAPQYPGLDQINFVVPAGLAAGDAQLLVRSLDRASNPTTLKIGSGPGVPSVTSKT